MNKFKVVSLGNRTLPPSVTQLKTIVNAIVLKPISYVNVDGVSIEVPTGTSIKVDIDRNIALIGVDHVDITQDEYDITHAN